MLGAPNPWLRPAASTEVERFQIDASTDIPVRFDGARARQRTHRCHTGMRASFDALAASAGARLAMPFRDDRFIAALAAMGGRRGFGNRAATLSRLAGHLLPPELLRRSDGVNRHQAFFGAASRAFATQWSGHGVDDEVVDRDVLRAAFPGRRRCSSSPRSPPNERMLSDSGYEKGTSVLDGVSAWGRIRLFDDREEMS